MPCSNAAKTRNQLKFAGVLQTPEPISDVSGPKFTMRTCGRHIAALQVFFPIVDTCLSCEDSPTKLCVGAHTAIYGDFFASCILSEPHAARFRPAS